MRSSPATIRLRSGLFQGTEAWADGAVLLMHLERFRAVPKSLDISY